MIVLSPSMPSSGCKANVTSRSLRGKGQSALVGTGSLDESMIECSSGRILKSQKKRKWLDDYL